MNKAIKQKKTLINQQLLLPEAAVNLLIGGTCPLAFSLTLYSVSNRLMANKRDLLVFDFDWQVQNTNYYDVCSDFA